MFPFNEPSILMGSIHDSANEEVEVQGNRYDRAVGSDVDDGGTKNHHHDNHGPRAFHGFNSNSTSNKRRNHDDTLPITSDKKAKLVAKGAAAAASLEASTAFQSDLKNQAAVEGSRGMTTNEIPGKNIGNDNKKKDNEKSVAAAGMRNDRVMQENEDGFIQKMDTQAAKNELQSPQDRHNSTWAKFAVTVDSKDASNLQEYLSTKEMRHQRREDFKMTIHECADALQKLALALVPESRLVCRRRKVCLSEIEQDIVSVFQSNSSRRQSCLTRMEDSDRKWCKNLVMVTSRVASGISYEDKTKEDSPTAKNKGPGKDNSKHSIENNTEDDVDAGDPDAVVIDWTSICEFQPAQKSVVPMLKATVNLHFASETIEMAQSAAEKKILDQITALVEHVDCTMTKMEDRVSKTEDEIERVIMSNHKRRVKYQKRVQLSANRAQSVFSGLLSGMFQS